MTEFFFSIGISTGLVMVLVLLVLAARARLVDIKEVQVTVNGDRVFRTSSQQSLLFALADAGILVAAGCGGKGTCGLCRIKVLSGGGAVLPTERAAVEETALAGGIRLACQLTITGDIAVEVPAEILRVGSVLTTVRSNRNVAMFMREIILALPSGESFPFKAGSFVQVTAPSYRMSLREISLTPEFTEEWRRLGLLDLIAHSDAPVSRAYSLANHPGEEGILMLLVRLAVPPPGSAPTVPPGIVSSYLFGLSPGDPLTVTGPYGSFHATDSEREMILVGGGAGMAPLRAMIMDQLEVRGATRKISFWYGARSRRDLFYVDQFEALAARHPNFRFSVALSESRAEDEWIGATGFIHEHLDRAWLQGHPAPRSCDYFLCGPPPMVRAVKALVAGYGVAEEDVQCDDFGS